MFFFKTESPRFSRMFTSFEYMLIDNSDLHTFQKSQGLPHDDVPPRNKAPAPSRAHPPLHCALASLPDMVLWRVLCALSAEDLSSLAQCSRFFNCVSSDNMLWGRLYSARWPKGKNEEEQDDNEQYEADNWKVLYVNRDKLELAKAIQHAPDEALQPLYRQMAVAKRSETLGLLGCDDLFTGGSPKASEAMTMTLKVAEYRKQHGVNHNKIKSCPESCKFEQLDGKVWICQGCGQVHPCGDRCNERKLDRGSNMLICPITGRCWHRLMSEFEEAQEGPVGGVDEGPGDDWNEDSHISGRLGRAFYAGYNAADEKEMLRRFGIKL